MFFKILLVILTKATLIVIAMNDDHKLDLFKWVPTFCERVTEFCGYGETHIACNKNNWHVRCLKPFSNLFEVRDEMKGIVTDKFNELRERVASGKLSDYNKASRMGGATWDDELGYMAELHCNSCEFTYDACFNTPSFPSAGQLTYAALYLEKVYNDDNVVDIIAIAFDEWFSTHKYGDNFFLSEYQRAGWRAERFGTLMLEENTRVGCAVLYYQLNNWHRYFITCNFAAKCKNFKPIYKFANVPGSGCLTGHHPYYPSLCSVDEKYDYKYVDNFY